MKHTIIIAVIVAVVAGGAGFVGGQRLAARRGGSGVLTPDERQARFGQFAGPNGQRGMRTGVGAAAGEVLSRDESGLTIKLPDGGSRVVLVPASVSVMKAASGSLDDIKVGSQVFISGESNADGSVTAKTIQLR